jgi:P pilus assembly chaperone PapD
MRDFLFGRYTTNKPDAAPCVFLRPIVPILVMINITAFSQFSTAQAPGGLTLTPTRVIFQGRHKSAEITLVNSTTEPSSYRISLKNMRMLEDGSYEDITAPTSGELFADKMIRFSPRQVTLQPNESQTIRLQLRRPADLPPGEYRSHLLVQTIPPESAGGDIEKVELQEGEIAVRITTIYAITIPVLVMNGNLSGSVTISNLKLTTSEDSLHSKKISLQLDRTGERSVPGEIQVLFKPLKGGDEQLVGLMRSVAVLFPYKSRTVVLPLAYPDGTDTENGNLRVLFKSRPEDGGEILAQAELPIP